MANLKEVRERIASVKSTQQITKAMKMVAAAKLRRAQQAIVQLRPYSNKLSAILSNILFNLGSDVESKFGVVRPIKKALVVVISSNRGLCGAFNSSVIKTSLELIEKKYAEQRSAGNLSVLFMGKKGYDFYRTRYSDIALLGDEAQIVDKDFAFEDSTSVSGRLIADFEAGKYDAIDIVYSQFKNAAIQNFIVEAFLPVAPPKTDTKEDTDKHLLADFIFQPNKAAILDHLIPTILNTQFYKTILDSNASEHGARMTAMDNATENANELLRELKINYNKARQEAITSEISEIVGGVAALENE